jgi:glutaminyl-tRNA synthetase
MPPLSGFRRRESRTTRQVPFSRAPISSRTTSAKFPRPSTTASRPARRFRLRNALFHHRTVRPKSADGSLVEVHCTYDPTCRGGNSPDGRKVKSTMQWVSAAHTISAEIRIYDKLFLKPNPSDVEEGQDVLDKLNPNSVEILTSARLEPSRANAKLEDRFQFERVGDFCLDPDTTAGKLVFNRTLALKDSGAKIEKKSPLQGVDAR